jgi:uncharacterized protein YegL
MAEGMVRERLNIYYLLDTSGSMSGARIQQLNTCMQELKPALEEAGIDNNVEIVVRAIEFGNGETARWHTGDKAKGVPIDSFTWMNLQANGGCTPTSVALQMVADALDPEYLGARTLRPVIILVTDGGCTDGKSLYTSACNALKAKISGNATRIAVGVENANKSELEEFATSGTIGEDTNKPFVFETDNAETMTEIIRWASIVSIKSSVKTGVGGGTGTSNGGGDVELTDPTWI